MNESTTKRLLTNEGVTGTLYVSAFCIVIALFLFGFGIARPFVPTLVISLAIGLSILWLSELFAPILEAYVSPTTASVVLTPVGLVLGLGVAGLINEFSVFAYFTTDNAALMLGIFFAMLGYLVFQSRSHLARVEAKLANAAVLQEQQQRTLKTSELKLLQAQIEPHFLFNTLSNIVGLVHTNPDGAEKALINLTTLLRSSLDQTRQSSTSLKEELALVDAYLAIQTIRMPNRLSYRFDPPIRALPESILQRSIPPLLLQPLVENAVQHGIDPLEEGGEVVIAIGLQEQLLKIQVIDTGVGLADSSVNGTGLENVRSRIRGLFDSRGMLSLSENKPRGLVVTLQLPEMIV